MLRALADTAPEVRAAAVRVAEPWLGKDGDPVQAAVRGLSGDRAARVRWQLALSIAAFPEASRVEQAVQLLAHHGRDPFVVDGVVSSLAGIEEQALAQLLARPGVPEDALGPLAGAVARGGRPAAVADLWTHVADARRPVAERLALARGVELALGTESFGVRTPRRLVLAAAPQPLLARAHERGEIETVVARLLDGMDWPGKPRKAEAVAPLSAAEQQRFEAGKEIYGRLCVACHQPDGRGREGLAPALAGSPFVTGRAGIMARIVIHGKEGKTLMPPLGSLSDADDRRGADLRTTLVRAHRLGGRRRARARSARLRARPRAPVDRGRAEGDFAAGRRSARAAAVVVYGRYCAPWRTSCVSSRQGATLSWSPALTVRSVGRSTLTSTSPPMMRRVQSLVLPLVDPAFWRARMAVREARAFDRRYATDTVRRLPVDAMRDVPGELAAHAVHYEASAIPKFRRAMRAVQRTLGPRVAEFSFVDVGSGKGLVVMLAARLPFREVVGVEMAPELHETAEQNLCPVPRRAAAARADPAGAGRRAALRPAGG